MRRVILASAATLIGGAALAQTMLGQSLPGQNTVVVPPAPPVVAAPPSAAPTPTVPPAAPPPGLVQTPFPPSGSEIDTSSGDSNSGGAGDASQMQAVSPSAGPLPSVNNVPQPSGATPPSSSTAAAPGQPAPPDVAPAPANNWVPGKTAELGVLNKVDGSTSTLTIPVGGQAVSGDLTVSVQACMVRPPGALPDTAIFVTLQQNASQGDGNQIYRGWMVRSAPGATDAGDADEAFRVIACS